MIPTSSIAVLLACVSMLGLVSYLLGWCIYTLYFHPLAAYPGPKIAAITKIWLGRVWFSGHYPRVLQNAHRKYGNVVRIGPNELSFNTVRAHHEIYSTPSRKKEPFVKDPKFYNNGDSVTVLFYEMDATEHAWQRKMLTSSFSSAAMRNQEPIIHRYVDMFVQKMGCLSEASHEAGIDFADTATWLGFDVMGAMTFGEAFGAIESGKGHFWISLLRDGARAAVIPAVSKQMPLLRMILPYVINKSVIENRKRHYAFTEETLRRRIRLQQEQKDRATADFFGPIIASGKMNEPMLVSLAQALVIAGADTVTHTLTGAVYFLCSNRACLKELQDELRGFSSYEELTGTRLAPLRYLNAVLEETMRAFPPISFGLPRVSPGDWVDGHYVPAGVTVSASHWVVTHNETEWKDPYAFRPERWLGEDEVSPPRGLAFSVGPRACIGIAQAWLELRIALAKLVYTYDLEFARDLGDWLGSTQLHMFWREPPLMVRFLPRKDLSTHTPQVMAG
ncbi:cytochrome P450 [Xylaria nigripes]|nr:cytochrome P450 [Xylaria nigripes]